MRENTKRRLAATGLMATWAAATAVRSWCYTPAAFTWWVLLVGAASCAFAAGWLIAFTRKDT